MLLAALIMLGVSTGYYASSWLLFRIIFDSVLQGSTAQEDAVPIISRLATLQVFLPVLNVRKSIISIHQKNQTLKFLQYIASDMIVVWRAWVLWNRSKMAIAPPVACVIFTAGSFSSLSTNTYIH